mmetsp:Transcript_10005/g.21863  ORF Transcript_10005/g.21863 Transcript_10005/m.21863 type:complete len:375 (-) Transcript_10005:699-1823(-)
MMENQLRRPRNAYTIFFQQERRKLVSAIPFAMPSGKFTQRGNPDLARQISQRWKSLPPFLKNAYIKRAEQERETYEAELSRRQAQQHQQHQQQTAQVSATKNRYKQSISAQSGSLLTSLMALEPLPLLESTASNRALPEPRTSPFTFTNNDHTETDTSRTDDNSLPSSPLALLPTAWECINRDNKNKQRLPITNQAPLGRSKSSHDGKVSFSSRYSRLIHQAQTACLIGSMRLDQGKTTIKKDSIDSMQPGHQIGRQVMFPLDFDRLVFANFPPWPRWQCCRLASTREPPFADAEFSCPMPRPERKHCWQFHVPIAPRILWDSYRCCSPSATRGRTPTLLGPLIPAPCRAWPWPFSAQCSELRVRPEYGKRDQS